MSNWQFFAHQMWSKHYCIAFISLRQTSFHPHACFIFLPPFFPLTPSSSCRSPAWAWTTDSSNWPLTAAPDGGRWELERLIHHNKYKRRRATFWPPGLPCTQIIYRMHRPHIIPHNTPCFYICTVKILFVFSLTTRLFLHSSSFSTPWRLHVRSGSKTQDD